ncbi:MAG: hypothetical protein CVV64_03785 [Candidatus Wallbacteria bacterium HGW-Wallbacteria-1]|jgi:murein DD-endopeptidase MepM/ murein hydrolase activator NlpD|uniref:M23ase beta-sheet core domain-containing protein n=1 Tax=Candidatus Wallbacteria bacterium HGW-Wallbacteria-1 TaxID=2013854 RepID=A0A2N1PTW7_9BACT|nr:MAG: hypothetical protein CVV64_03785 [Candidatus Wallbacteria bacterium HGW-Wallbacteria-1]
MRVSLPTIICLFLISMLMTTGNVSALPSFAIDSQIAGPKFFGSASFRPERILSVDYNTVADVSDIDDGAIVVNVEPKPRNLPGCGDHFINVRAYAVKLDDRLFAASLNTLPTSGSASVNSIGTAVAGSESTRPAVVSGNRKRPAGGSTGKSLRSGKILTFDKWPVGGAFRVSSPYGYRMHPLLRKWKFHNGVDLAAKRGTPIVAAAGGVVIYSGWKAYFGRTVMIEHPSGYTTIYAHCSSLKAQKGDRIQKGQIIAKVGRSGSATGNHLHFSIKEGDQYVSPTKYLKKL